MSKKIFVVSTLATDVCYTGYTGGEGQSLPRVAVSVTIKGGAGVANRRTIITPRGVVTEVNEEQAKFLAQHPVFRRHMARGFLSETASKVDGDEAAADMTGRDESAPLVDQDIEDKPETPQVVKNKK